jgi:hypothetical protein
MLTGMSIRDDRLKRARAQVRVRIEVERERDFGAQHAAYLLARNLAHGGFVVNVVEVGATPAEVAQRRRAIKAA